MAEDADCANLTAGLITALREAGYEVTVETDDVTYLVWAELDAETHLERGTNLHRAVKRLARRCGLIILD